LEYLENQECQKILRRIAEALEKLVEQAVPDSKLPTEVHVDDSQGTCPSCQCLEVLLEGDYPRTIYKCCNCGHVWVNDEDSWFQT
jgi:hypothetical protein